MLSIWKRIVRGVTPSSVRQYGRSCCVLHPPAAFDDLELLPVVAIIGRPNVGKSALFNRFVGRREAMVWNTPQGHVTRDYKESVGQLYDLRFRVVDTSGLEPFMATHTIQARATKLTERLLRSSDLALFLLDARTGVGPMDHDLTLWLRRFITCPLLLAINKAERRDEWVEAAVADAAVLGLGLPVPVSAETGLGMHDLYEQMQPLIDAAARRKLAVRTGQDPDRLGGSGRVSEEHIEASHHIVVLNAPAKQDSSAAAEASGRQLEAEAEDAEDSTEADVRAILAHYSGGAFRLASAEEDAAHQTLVGEPCGSQECASSRAGASGEGGAGTQAATAGAAAAAFDSSPPGRSEGVLDEEDERAVAELKAVEQVGGAFPHEFAGEDGAGEQKVEVIRLAIMGLPNVGKSTLLNHLVGQDRCLTGPEPGLTRDPVSARFQYRGRPIQLVDTAGWVRKAQLAQYDDVGGNVARMTIRQGNREMLFANVVLLLVDAAEAFRSKGKPLTRREVALASDVVAEGRVLIVAANKLDCLSVPQQQQLRKALMAQLEAQVADVGSLPCLALSALSGDGVDDVMQAVLEGHRIWNMRIGSARLSRWLERAALAHTGSGRTAYEKAIHIWQAKARPPTFVAFMRRRYPISNSDLRTLSNGIRNAFKLHGVPLRVHAATRNGI